MMRNVGQPTRSGEGYVLIDLKLRDESLGEGSECYEPSDGSGTEDSNDLVDVADDMEDLLDENHGWPE